MNEVCIKFPTKLLSSLGCYYNGVEVMHMQVRSFVDPLELIQHIAKERAKALVLWEMESKKQELKDFISKVPSMNADKITKELGELIELGLVSRVVHVKVKPQKIEYALTNRGAQFLKCLRKMMGIGIDIMLDYGMTTILEKQGYIDRIDEE